MQQYQRDIYYPPRTMIPSTSNVRPIVGRANSIVTVNPTSAVGGWPQRYSVPNYPAMESPIQEHFQKSVYNQDYKSSVRTLVKPELQESAFASPMPRAYCNTPKPVVGSSNTRPANSLMPLPAGKSFSTRHDPGENMNATNVNLDDTRATNVSSNVIQPKIFGTSDNEKMFMFSGTVERVIKWNKIFCNHFCYYEIFGSLISVQDGNVRTQKIMLLRDKNKGPILQIIYYVATHIDLEDLYSGKLLRCVGKMTGPNVLNALSIRGATDEELAILQRLSLVCDQAVSHFLSV